MAKRELIGKVIDNAGQPRAGTDVWLSGGGVETLKTETGQDGSFSFTLGDELEAGTYRLEALPTPDALGDGRSVELAESGSPAPVVIAVESRAAVSKAAGWIFLLVTIGFLAFLTGLYLDLHGFSLEHLQRGDFSSVQKTKEISSDLSRILAIAKEQAVAASAALAGRGELSDEERSAAAREALASSMAMDSVGAAEGIFSDLKKRRLGTLDPSKVAAVESLFAQAGKAAESVDLKGVESAVANLETAVHEPEEPFFWAEKPGILLECLYWALAATLIRLIFRSGLYLYKGSFLKTAIPHHLAVAISVPMLAVLISFFLSLVQVSFSVSDMEFVLDMSNVYIVILVAALIGLAPWQAWDFLMGLADRLFATLAGLLKSKEPAT